MEGSSPSGVNLRTLPHSKKAGMEKNKAMRVLLQRQAQPGKPLPPKGATTNNRQNTMSKCTVDASIELAGFMLLSQAAWEINKQGHHEAYVSMMPGFASASLTKVLEEGRLTMLNRMVDINEGLDCVNLAVELCQKAGLQVEFHEVKTPFGGKELVLEFADEVFTEEEGGAA